MKLLCFAAAILAFGVCQAGAQPTTKTAARPQLDRSEPCCAITAVNAATGIVTAKVTATGKTFTFRVDPSRLKGFAVGAKVDFKPAEPVGVIGSAASSGTMSGGGSGTPGNNSPRGADTRPKDCVATTSSGAEIRIACPQNVPIKTTPR